MRDKAVDEMLLAELQRKEENTFNPRIQFKSRPLFLDEARKLVEKHQLDIEARHLSEPLSEDKIKLNVEARDSLRINHLQIQILKLVLDKERFMPNELQAGSGGERGFNDVIDCEYPISVQFGNEPP